MEYPYLYTFLFTLNHTDEGQLTLREDGVEKCNRVNRVNYISTEASLASQPQEDKHSRINCFDRSKINIALLTYTKH